MLSPDDPRIADWVDKPQPSSSTVQYWLLAEMQKGQITGEVQYICTVKKILCICHPQPHCDSLSLSLSLSFCDENAWRRQEAVAWLELAPAPALPSLHQTTPQERHTVRKRASCYYYYSSSKAPSQTTSWLQSCMYSICMTSNRKTFLLPACDCGKLPWCATTSNE